MLTNAEAIRFDLMPYPASEGLIRRKCIKHRLIYDDPADDERAIAAVVIELLAQMLKLNNIAEGGVALSFDRKGVEEQIKNLCSDHGLELPDCVKAPTVRRYD